jgi:MPBQ/MSBQ methyltransferase
MEGGSDFHNFGYWDQATTTLREGVRELDGGTVGFHSREGRRYSRYGLRKGATSRYLLNFYNPKDVTGINISEKQLERCRVNAPGCNFYLMNATELAFPDESF